MIRRYKSGHFFCEYYVSDGNDTLIVVDVYLTLLYSCNLDFLVYHLYFIQVPFLFGVTAIEKVASCVIHWIFRRTGKHLFLTDNDEGKPPLLQRMVENCDDLHFMYVLFLPCHIYLDVINFAMHLPGNMIIFHLQVWPASF